MSRCRVSRICKWAVIAVAASSAHAGPAPRVAITHHVANIRGHSIAYTAIVSDNIVADASGKPGAAVITIAYLRDGVKDLSNRPLIFAFNGGPGASSSPLHMEALGPVLRAGDRAHPNADSLVSNPSSPLDVADLVFIDPVSTGFSRSFPGVDPRQWYSGRGDAIEVAEVIRDWIKAHHREGSPVYICGESYGTMRAGFILKYAPWLKVNGVLLVSGGGGDPGPYGADIDRVGKMAVAAWYYGVVDRRGRTAQEVYTSAMKFARGEYAQALGDWGNMSAAARRRAAVHFSGIIGLPTELILAKNLRIDTQTFAFNLLKPRGLRTGFLDSRVTSALMPNAAGAIDDPSLGVVTPKAGGKVPTVASVGAWPSPAVGRYVSQVLRFPATGTYYGVNFTANSQWKFSAADKESTSQILARAMKADPKLRLFAVAGLFDLGTGDTTGFVAEGVPADRLTVELLPGPHEVYSGDENRGEFDDAVRNFVLGGRH